MRLIHGERSLVLAEEVHFCRTLWEQLRGVIGREPGPEEAFAFPACHQVHTVSLGAPLDLVFCDGSGIVLWVGTIAPWRISPYIFNASVAYEARAGAFAIVRLGERLAVL